MNKKTLVSMITGALVVGAASTTFAAANPFSDVPANSWAYDAVAKLAADGVVDGFPDGTFRGNQDMTRYQMAQIVAKAMTKENMTKADKALVDKLAAEFSQELDNLGVRVSNLEKRSDNVKWGGKFEYKYNGSKFGNADRSNDQQYQFRLTPQVFIGNTGWTANAEIRYYGNANTGNDGGAGYSADQDGVRVTQMNVQGNFGKTAVTAGKYEAFSDNTLGSGMVNDTYVSGIQLVQPMGKDMSLTLSGSKIDLDAEENAQTVNNNKGTNGTGTFASAELGYAPANSKFKAIAGYYTLRGTKDAAFTSFINATGDATTKPAGAALTTSEANGNVSDNIWSAGMGYQFNKNVGMYGIYAKSNLDSAKGYKGDDQSKAYDITVSYKGADKTVPGSWGAYVAYRYLGAYASIDPTYDINLSNTKAWTIGTTYTIAQNVQTTLEYAKGKTLSNNFGGNDADYNALYGAVDFYF